MKRVSSLFLIVVLMVSFFAIPVKKAKATIPATVNYQGRLKDATNTPLSGNYDFRFRLYDDVLKTTLLWGPEEHLNQTVSNGYFDIQLGSIVTFTSAGLDFTDRYWLTLEIKENTAGAWDTETDPPVSFNAYAYALNAEKVDSSTGLVNIGNTIQAGAALVGAETAFNINTGAGFTGDLLSLSNNGTNYLTIDSVGDAAFTGTTRLSMENNTVNDLIGLKVIQTNDVGNYSGSILELKGSGPDYTNNVYFGKYGDGFWVTDWAGNGVLATDQDLILGSMGSTDATNPNPDPRILFQIGGGYSTPITTAILESDNFNFLPYDTVAGATASMRFSELAANGTNYVGFKAPDIIAANQLWNLPSADGLSGNALITDGSGNLSWGNSSVSAANGVVDNSGTIELGGTMLRNTNIDLNTFGLQFDASNGYFVTNDTRTEFAYGDSYFTAEDSGFEVEAASPASVTSLYIKPEEMVIYNYDVGTGLPHANFHGLTYDVDFSGNYTDRSLVDKAYVDSLKSFLWDTDSDTGIQVEESADDDIIRFDTAGTERMVVLANGNVGIGLSDPSTTLHVDSAAANTEGILTLENTAGDIQIFRTDATPESAVTGSIGDLAVDGTGGSLYIKETGNATNTGWSEVGAGGAAGAVISQIDLTVATPDGNFSSGGFVGYQAANDMCNSEFAGSHFCRTDEIVEFIANNSTAAFANTAWIAEGPPGYTSNSNDCNGWTDNDASKLGAFWQFVPAGGGMGWLTNCAVTKSVACCQ